MPPAPRHSNEEQQQIILTAAAKTIARTSLLDFTMSAISTEAGLSMGTIYKHIQCKEDVLLALATAMFDNIYTIFDDIMAQDLPITQRLMALQLICPEKTSLYGFDAHLSMLVNSDAVLQRASSNWIEKMNRADDAIEQLLNRCLQQAMDDDAMLGTDDEEKAQMANEIHLGLWSLCVGFFQVAQQRHCRKLSEDAIALPFPLSVEHSIVRASKRFLNSFPWAQPLSDDDLHDVCKLLQSKGYR